MILLKKDFYIDFIILAMIVFLSSCEKSDMKWDLDRAPVLSEVTFGIYTLGKAEVLCACIDDGNNPDTQKGFCWSRTPNPTINQNKITSSQQGIGKFYHTFQWSNQEVIYVRAFAKNDFGVVYSNEVQLRELNVGDSGPAGGYIFYVNTNQVGWNYLEAAPNDYGSAVWNGPISNFSPTFSNYTAIGYGLNNTGNVTSFFGQQYLFAASICYNYMHNNYTDWFLPSRDELIKVYENLYINNIGNLRPNAIYWSSSEDAFFNQNAWTVKMSLIDPNKYLSYKKDNNYFIRPIRRF